VWSGEPIGEYLRSYPRLVSIAEEWDFTVPEDDSELLAELRRHGVAPGRRLHVSIASDGRALERDPALTRRRLSFTASIQSQPDLSENTDEYLRGLGRT